MHNQLYFDSRKLVRRSTSAECEFEDAALELSWTDIRFTKTSPIPFNKTARIVCRHN
jgi:hypothetical protein